jgi:hypothetical protein
MWSRAGRGSRSCASELPPWCERRPPSRRAPPVRCSCGGALDWCHRNASRRAERHRCVGMLGTASPRGSLDSSTLCGCSRRQDSEASNGASTGAPLRLEVAQALTAASVTPVRRGCCRVWALSPVSLLCGCTRSAVESGGAFECGSRPLCCSCASALEIGTIESPL